MRLSEIRIGRLPLSTDLCWSVYSVRVSTAAGAPSQVFTLVVRFLVSVALFTTRASGHMRLVAI